MNPCCCVEEAPGDLYLALLSVYTAQQLILILIAARGTILVGALLNVNIFSIRTK